MKKEKLTDSIDLPLGGQTLSNYEKAIEIIAKHHENPQGILRLDEDWDDSILVCKLLEKAIIYLEAKYQRKMDGVRVNNKDYPQARIEFSYTKIIKAI